MRFLFTTRPKWIGLSHKAHKAPAAYLKMHHFVTEMRTCRFLLQNYALWDITLAASWDLWDWSIGRCYVDIFKCICLCEKVWFNICSLMTNGRWGCVSSGHGFVTINATSDHDNQRRHILSCDTMVYKMYSWVPSVSWQSITNSNMTSTKSRMFSFYRFECFILACHASSANDFDDQARRKNGN